MIDCHCHLLHGIDDGPETLEGSVAMARMLERLGFTEVHCTPHCIHGLYQNTSAIVTERLTALRRALDREGSALRLKPGMEYYLDSHFPRQLDNPQPLGESRLLLVEAPTWALAEMVLANLRQIVARGYVPVLAHPERWSLLDAPGAGAGFWRRASRAFGGKVDGAPGLLDELRRLGCLFQGNLGSFAGRYGKEVERRARAFLEADLYSCFGSDSHPRPGLEEMISAGIGDLLRNAGEAGEFVHRPRLPW